MAESGNRVPVDLARAVRDMLLDEKKQARYREGISITGMVNTSEIYSPVDREDYQRQAIYNKND